MLQSLNEQTENTGRSLNNLCYATQTSKLIRTNVQMHEYRLVEANYNQVINMSRLNWISRHEQNSSTQLYSRY